MTEILDVNECQSSNGGCEQVCTNTIGSFECSCNPGFNVSSNGANCIGKMVQLNAYHNPIIAKYTDINECQTNNGGCEQICNNTDGSFECSCNQGYSLSSDGTNCIGKQYTIIILIIIKRTVTVQPGVLNNYSINFPNKTSFLSTIYTFPNCSQIGQ